MQESNHIPRAHGGTWFHGYTCLHPQIRQTSTVWGSRLSLPPCLCSLQIFLISSGGVGGGFQLGNPITQVEKTYQKKTHLSANFGVEAYWLFKKLDAGYPESKEDSLINEMFGRVADMNSVRSIETKCSIHMYNSTKTQVQSQCLNKQQNPAKVERKKS